MTVLLYVRRKSWPLKSVTVKCSHELVRRRDAEECEESDRRHIDLIRCHVLLEGDLTVEQRDRIARIARRCPVHRTLRASPRIEDEVEMVG